MKKIMLLIVLLLLFGCSNKLTPKKAPSLKYCGDEAGTVSCGIQESADMSEYKGFDKKDNQFKETNMKDAINIFKDKKTSILFFGYPRCPWCIEAIPILNEVAAEDHLYVQYVRTRGDDKRLLYTEKEKNELIPYLKQYLKKDKDGEYAIYVPFVVVVKDGKAISGHIGTVDSHDATERNMNAKEKAEVKSIYEKMFAKIKK